MTGKVVLDTSAVLALCFAEAGQGNVATRGTNGIISTVNYSEVIAKSTDFGVPLETVTRALAGLKLTILPFDEQHAVAAASLRAVSRTLNLSFADRACLSTAALARRPVLTANPDWLEIDTPFEIIVIRQRSS